MSCFLNCNIYNSMLIRKACYYHIIEKLVVVLETICRSSTIPGPYSIPCRCVTIKELNAFFHADCFFFIVRYDGDPIIGHRFYREVVKVDFKQKWKGKGRLTQPTIDYRWETLATNLEEFLELSV